MDPRGMRDIDVYPPANAEGVDTGYENSDYIQQLSSINFWDNLDRSADSSFVNSAAASAQQTPSTAAESPASHSSHDHYSKGSSNSHKHKLTAKSAPKKRRCSDHTKSKFSQDPSPLDCSDYWLRFDSDSESLELFGEQNPNGRKNVRSPSLAHPLSRHTSFGVDDSVKVAFHPATSDLIDDSALDHALSDDDDLFPLGLTEQLHKTESAPVPSEVPPRERLYSTPLSWERPQPGFQTEYVDTNRPLTDQDRQRLLAIAMGTGQAPLQLRSAAGMDFRFEYNQSPSTMTDGAASTPDIKPKITAPRSAGPSRRNSSNEMDKPKDKPRNNDRAAHNDIERKYRTNLKDKISDLRNAIPSLRSIPEDADDNENGQAGSRTAPKVSKGTVLTKATEYIHQLERRNRSIAQKNDELARRLHAFEQLVGSGAGPTWHPQGYGASVFNPRFS